MKFAHAGVCDPLAFFSRRWASEKHAFLDIALHLPQVRGMSLIDIDDVERNTIFVLPIQLVERGNLPAEGWSSVAPKNENDRLCTAKT
jgi:hypothetical protein